MTNSQEQLILLRKLGAIQADAEAAPDREAAQLILKEAEEIQKALVKLQQTGHN